jgi:chromosome segregation ATPase
MEEEKKFAFLKRAETFNENENLRQELEKQKYEIQKQRKEIETLQSQIGGLSYDLNNMKEMEKEIENLKKENGNLKTDVEPLKNKNKKLNQEIKRLNNQIKISQNQMNTKENTLARIEEMELKMDEESESIMCSIKSFEETTSEFMDATTIFRNMTRRYETLITQLEQKKLSDDIQRLEIMKNKNHCEEINQLKEKVDLKRQLFDFCSENYSSTLKFLKNEIQLESELLKLFEMRKKNITETEKLDSAEAKGIEMKIDLYGRAGENHVKELKSCREIYTELQKNILNHEENYENINQLLVKE